VPNSRIQACVDAKAPIRAMIASMCAAEVAMTAVWVQETD
jgi:hypothetical protein